MKRILLAATAALAFAAAQPAIAADAPVYRKGPAPAAAAVFNWSGFYIGANAGYAWGRALATDVVATNGACWTSCGAQWNSNVGGFTGGFQAGWNVQLQSLVLGIEGDVGYLGLKGSGLYALEGSTFVETRGGWFATLRGRAGFLVSPTILAYATGGAIYADTRTNVYRVPDLNTDNAAGWGWTVGGGVEIAADPRWTWKLEYLYYDLGTKQVGSPCCGGGIIQFFTINQTGHIVRIGANWKM